MIVDSKRLKLHPVLLVFFFIRPSIWWTAEECCAISANRVVQHTTEIVSRGMASRALIKFPRHPQVCVLVADAEWRGPVLYGLPHHQELLWRTRGLYKNQGLRRRGGCDRAGRRISFRDAGAGGGQICRCRSVGRQEYGNCREAELDYLA